MRTALFALLALSAGCRALEPDPTLYRFDDCEAMRSYMEDMALREVRYSNRVDFGIPVFSTEYSLSKFDSVGIGDGDPEHSTTNLQEEGVDEADLVKTDGENLFVISGDQLVISRAWPIGMAEELSRVHLDGRPEGLYLYDDAVVVISRFLLWDELTPEARAQVEVDGEWGVVLVTVVDVTDVAAPEVIRETYVDGQYRDSRRIGENLYVVATADLAPFSYQDDLAEALKKVREAEPTEWLPRQTDAQLVDGEWVVTTDPTCGCEDVWRSNRETGTVVSSVMSLDLSDLTSRFGGQAVVGASDTVYVSPNTVYATYSERADGPFRSLDEQLDTIVHAFDITEGQPAYLDTLQLTGVLTDQFALSEYRDVLRVATTDQSTWTTHVWTFGRQDDHLDRLDHLGGLAPGEELYAVRFVGDLGYLVTYEVAQDGQTAFDIQFGDPLFTLDLSDPEHIEALGELVLNGWSDYIHPLPDSQLLTVGMDEDDGGTWKVAVSLFDVSDLTDPVLVDRELLEASRSEAQLEHHAFNYFAPKEVLALPSRTLSDDSVLEIVHVDSGDVSSIGRVEQNHLLGYESWSPCTTVRRSVIFEDYVWTYSEAGLTASALDEPETVLASLDLYPSQCMGWW